MLCQHLGCDKTAKKRVRNRPGGEQKYHKFCGPHLYQHTRHHLPRKRERRKEVDVRLKQTVFAAYAGGTEVCCKCCGESKLDFLVLDHVNNDGAKHREQVKASNGHRRSSAGGHIFYRWLKANGFPQTPPLQILCANCNMGKQSNGGVCPHVTNRPLPTGSGSAVSSAV